MNLEKELLLAVATTLVSAGTILIQTDVVKGAIVMLVGAGVFVGRGFYKKYLETK